MSSSLRNVFSGWRIVLAILLGLGFSIFMLVKSMSESQFVEVDNGGDFIWVDGNHNGKVDLHFSEDFESVPDKSGNYDYKSMSSALSTITWTSGSVLWLFMAVLFMIGRDLFYIIRIRLLTDNKLSWKSGFYVIMIWEFASTLTPGVVGGAAVAMFILKREGIALGKATATVIITALMDNLFYILLIPFVLFILGNDLLLSINGNSSAFLEWWFWVGFILIFCVALLLSLSIFWLPGLAKSVLTTFTRLPFLKRWHESSKQLGDDIRVASREFRVKPFLYWVKVFGATFGSWLSRYLVINAILSAFLHISLFDHVRILGKQLILWLFMLVSPTPGGSGVAEFAFSELLSGFSKSALLLAALAVLWRLISYFPYLFIGSFLLPRWLRRKRPKQLVKSTAQDN